MTHTPSKWTGAHAHAHAQGHPSRPTCMQNMNAYTHAHAHAHLHFHERFTHEQCLPVTPCTSPHYQLLQPSVHFTWLSTWLTYPNLCPPAGCCFTNCWCCRCCLRPALPPSCPAATTCCCLCCRGRVLFGRLMVQPVCMTGVHSVLMDEAEDVVRVSGIV